ncbi:hypothetical protein X275_01155 [Marinitoga sp. 1197]|uniref:hypothetical protein n=1 Tax=unclassified Marinitoga TaxID=2640159 RepID=UPI0006413075|nr:MULTISPECIES: hypothetical protein [unclassified Marinitoga]AJW76957.1 hypothetical protein UF08_68 [Marinitoga camini virus 1]AMS33983.1 hypothetical protein UF09_67 [Marinitoga camini virus 2]KLO24032.1 hypothetical protein X275_01155 [Marinitoga sp. 1197]KLO24792.1 hypothetical protein X274_02235 [Marinitoga sp. 1155]
MNLKVLEKNGMFFDNVVFQLNWFNPRIIDKSGEIISNLNDTIGPFKIIDGGISFVFKKYEKFEGLFHIPKAWFRMSKLDSNHNFETFKNQSFKIISESIKHADPVNIKSFGTRIALIYSSENIREKIAKLIPFEIESAKGNLDFPKLQWKYVNEKYKTNYRLTQNIQMYYGKQNENNKRDDLPDEGVVIDIDCIIFRNDNKDSKTTDFKSEINGVFELFDKITTELVEKLG